MSKPESKYAAKRRIRLAEEKSGTKLSEAKAKRYKRLAETPESEGCLYSNCDNPVTESTQSFVGSGVILEGKFCDAHERQFYNHLKRAISIKQFREVSPGSEKRKRIVNCR